MTRLVAPHRRHLHRCRGKRSGSWAVVLTKVRLKPRRRHLLPVTGLWLRCPSKNDNQPQICLPQLWMGKSFRWPNNAEKSSWLNVWASWCAPCRAEAPALSEVYEETDRDEVEFVGVSDSR